MRHLIVRKYRDCLCILNPGAQSCCLRHSFSGFIVPDLFTYLFSLGCPVAVLSSGILLAKEDHRLFFFCLRCFECSVQSIPPQLHEACHSIAKQDSRTKFIVIQVWESCVCSKDDSSMRQSAQESKNWNLTWLSKVLLSILYPILKRNVLSWTKVSVLSNSTATHMIMLLLSYGWCLKWNSKQEEECRFISTFKPLGMGHPLS